MEKKFSFPFDPVGDGWFRRYEHVNHGVPSHVYKCLECDFALVTLASPELMDDDRNTLEDHALFHEGLKKTEAGRTARSQHFDPFPYFSLVSSGQLGTAQFECITCDFKLVVPYGVTAIVDGEVPQGDIELLKRHSWSHEFLEKASSSLPSEDEKLSAIDYMNRPIHELVIHPDFNNKAWLICVSIMSMDNDELLALYDMIGES